MSNKMHHYLAVNTIVNHALLHLIFTVKFETRYVPVKQRNQILVKWLKHRVDLKCYTHAKRDIKDMIHIGRKNGADLETKLWQLVDLNRETMSKFQDTDWLFLLFQNLNEQYKYASCILDDDQQEYLNKTIYMAKSAIEIGFNDDNQQVAPLSIYIKSDDAELTLSHLKNCSDYHEYKADDHANGILHIQVSKTHE